MADQLKRLYRVSTIFLPIFFDKDTIFLTPGTIFSREEPLIAPVIANTAHYIELIQFFWKKMPWKVDHKSNPDNQGEVLWGWYVVGLFAGFEGGRHLCLPYEFYNLYIHWMII